MDAKFAGMTPKGNSQIVDPVSAATYPPGATAPAGAVSKLVSVDPLKPRV